MDWNELVNGLLLLRNNSTKSVWHSLNPWLTQVIAQSLPTTLFMSVSQSVIVKKWISYTLTCLCLQETIPFHQRSDNDWPRQTKWSNY